MINELKKDNNKLLKNLRKTMQDVNDYLCKGLEIMKRNEAKILEIRNSIESFGGGCGHSKVRVSRLKDKVSVVNPLLGDTLKTRCKNK